ncbi:MULTISPECIES: nucleoside permease [Alteromonas]|jgi:nucleoside transporter|uniref:MFS transporter n=1 Tax=Alteromonas stellipolaris TaxID=233316 RepID=A0AAW7Z4Y7_9ALTE|nr:MULTISPECIES: nucleoside permease [Alteromonas]AMJ89295.1 MFS transporter [Alteromonas sp. Mac2]ALM92177.1 nucleoside transporter YegT [Alteromonas stellipolaris LMG 21856]AMJ73018.1 MFS transporter [Alteromonas stellipolaris]AMJ85410.1 MFS transporter [Alteromonas sp. Mac1]AMJ93129.1 MFS transporter [Alteromonas stellipolaris]
MITLRLSTMMFLQFFIWGGWFVTLGTYLAGTLAASGGQIGMAFSTQSWGAIIAPFIVGLIADRFFNAERILGVLHLCGAVLMYMMYQASDFTTFYPYVLGYMIAYMPTLALVNSVAFGQMTNPSKEFGKIRVWGTVGWIVAGLLISYVFSWDSTSAIADGMLRNTFMLCAIASLALGIFSFTLPATPPKAAGQKTGLRDVLGLDALALLKDKNFFVFFLSSVLICIPLAFYYQNANPFLTEIGVENATGKMTLGQVSEVLFMLALPVFLNKFGIKATLLIGMAAWVLRYALFAFGNADEGLFMLIVGIALHGICYDFFFVSGQIYTDAKAGERIKSAAQGLITLATYGVGMLIGFAVAGKITDEYTTATSHSWQDIWLFPAGFAAVVLIIFLMLFKSEKVSTNA